MSPCCSMQWVSTLLYTSGSGLKQPSLLHYCISIYDIHPLISTTFTSLHSIHHHISTIFIYRSQQTSPDLYYLYFTSQQISPDIHYCIFNSLHNKYHQISTTVSLIHFRNIHDQKSTIFTTPYNIHPQIYLCYLYFTTYNFYLSMKCYVFRNVGCLELLMSNGADHHVADKFGRYVVC